VNAPPGGGWLLADPALPVLALLWALLPAHYYLATGHGNVFASLDFASAFIGFDRFSRVRSGALLLVSTYGTHALTLACGAAPLLADAAARPGGLLRAAALLLALPTCVALVTSAFCLFARRHLMVWAVFAPKWVFDAASWGVSVACVAAAAAAVSAVAAGDRVEGTAGSRVEGVHRARRDGVKVKGR